MQTSGFKGFVVDYTNHTTGSGVTHSNCVDHKTPCFSFFFFHQGLHKPQDSSRVTRDCKISAFSLMITRIIQPGQELHAAIAWTTRLHRFYLGFQKTTRLSEGYANHTTLPQNHSQTMSGFYSFVIKGYSNREMFIGVLLEACIRFIYVFENTHKSNLRWKK